MEEIYETRIRKFEHLDKEQQKELEQQLKNISGDFDYRGYVKISYALILKPVKVEPIQGSPLDEFKRINSFIETNASTND